MRYVSGMKKLLLTTLILLSARVMAQGLIVGYDVPYPTEYEIRPGANGCPYILVRKFERRQYADFVGPRMVG